MLNILVVERIGLFIRFLNFLLIYFLILVVRCCCLFVSFFRLLGLFLSLMFLYDWLSLVVFRNFENLCVGWVIIVLSLSCVIFKLFLVVVRVILLCWNSKLILDKIFMKFNIRWINLIVNKFFSFCIMLVVWFCMLVDFFLLVVVLLKCVIIVW